MELLYFLLSCSVFLSPAEQAPSYLITAPNIVHVGVEETVAIQLDGAEGSVSVTVYLLDRITNEHCSDRVTFELNAANGHHQIKKIIARPDLINKANIWKRREKYVYLTAQSSKLFSGNRMVPILISSKKGYIFIQTNKPIYTPDENVSYRIFTLDHYMRLVEETVKVTVYNSRNMQFPSEFVQSKIGDTRIIKIPDIAKPGNWRIEVQFDGFPMSMVSAQFEVKEFVLPSFKVEVKAEEMFYLITRDAFKFEISARHTYGKNVEGMAYVRFGIIGESNNHTYIRGLEQQLQIKFGVVVSSLKREMLLEKMQTSADLSSLVGHHLYMAVTVFETSSGQMEEVELRNIKFVSSPYLIDLSRTSGYFVPNFPFTVLVRVTYPDGSPASGVPVMLEGTQPSNTHSFNTQKDGRAQLTMPSPANTEAFDIKVIAGDGTPGREIAEARKTVRIYNSNSKSYLFLDVPHQILDPGSSFSAQISASNPAGSGNVYYYMIVSKGKVLDMGKIAKRDITVLPITMSTAMVPAFRLIVYYNTYVGGSIEMVANSAWIDVKDVCEGKITIKKMHKEYRPGDNANIFITIEDSGSLSLAIVDTAIYILNSKNKLTPSKVFEEMNAYDLGCTFGGGADSVRVFMDAGLTFISNVVTSTIRNGYSCKTDDRRAKRSLHLQGLFMRESSQYTNSSLQSCCTDGMITIPMKRTCNERAKRVKDKECRKAFLKCCELAVRLRSTEALKVDDLGRTAGGYEEEFFDDTTIQIRSHFPQSWQWRTYTDLDAREHKFQVIIPDSITTWEVQAVGAFQSKGFCVAEPIKMKVFKPFFLYLRLPYSVKRNEQLEVRVILYNYHHGNLTVNVSMKATDNLCSPATKQKHERTVTVRKNSAYPLYFSVVPLAIGNIPITVIAYSIGDMVITDAVTRKLNVLGEGVLKTEDRSISIDPLVKRSYQILGDVPSNMVPDTKSYLYVRARGDVLGESVQNCLSPNGIDRLIQLPTGCTEQTTFRLAPTVFAVHYLDKSDQWICLKAERKDEALGHIKAGYQRILEHKGNDGSYGGYNHYPGSTWLTAYIVKILSIAMSQTDVKKEHIQQSVSFLLNSQKTTGEFYDNYPVFSRLQGGINKAAMKIPTTAFVTIALFNSMPAYYSDPEKKEQVKARIQRAVTYLAQELANIEQKYTLAITAYALALVDSGSSIAQEADAKLKQKAIYDPENDARHWNADETQPQSGKPEGEHQASAVSIETTSYALLQTIAMKDFKYAKPIAKWLTEQRRFEGGFRSTQDTIVAMEALSQYSIATFEPEQLDLQFTFSHPNRRKTKSFEINRDNALIQDELTFPLGEHINIEVKGKGTGTITLLKSYQILAEATNTCDYFKLEINVKGKVELAVPPDYSNYGDYGDYVQGDQPLREIDLFDLRSRRRREAPGADEQTEIYYEVCAWHMRDLHQNQTSPGMAIVDISLLSGFEPQQSDLKKLQDLSDRYIDAFEFKDGRVLLYLETVTERQECVMFAAKQIFPIGLIQPASATLYDYYNPSTKCNIFYNAPKQSTIISKLCQQDVCECAEGLCPRKKFTFAPHAAGDARMGFACYTPIVEYAFIVNVSAISQIGSFDAYEVSITKRIKLGSDVSIGLNDVRHFLKRDSCPMKLQLHKSYLLMGKDGQTKDDKGNKQYLLDSYSWIEEMPSEEECQGTKARRVCAELTKFIDDLRTFGCQL
ncbi:complement C4-like [Scyliorhinus canicula]|uniref:complement C4-like n=1 Tax=Scyliorhinus canicula TaxID=7830 RepID=UPI0018F6C383|nr:complement C4-like [Scyliorhinus canicula]